MNQALINLYKMRDKLPNLPPDKNR
jgi:hypothetical protein